MSGRRAPLLALLAFLAFLVLLAAALGAPTAAAQESETMPALVVLEQAGSTWNGEVRTQVPLETDDGFVELWVPPGARIQQVVGVEMRFEAPGSETPASWRAAGPEAIRVQVPPNSTYVRVAFDVSATPPFLPDYVAPRAIDRLELRVAPAEGLVVESPQAHFASSGGLSGGPPYVATLRDLEPGERVQLRAVDAERIAELPVLTAVLLMAALGLLGGVLWHRVRPPLGGRAPERFVEHLSELQSRLMPPVVLFALLNVLYFTMGLRVVGAHGFPTLLPAFGPDVSLAARAFDAFAERLVPAGVQLVVTRPVDAVLAQFGTALLLAFTSTLPLLLYEVAAFLAPGLLPEERRLAMRALPLVSGLFVVGALFGLLVMAPLMMRTLYGFADGIGATPLLLVQELVGFALLILFVFGLAFQLPVLMYALSRFGLVRSATYGRYWRHAVVGIFLAAGLLTPDPSLVSQALVAVPLVVLYALGLGVSRWGERAHDAARA